jgi:hypothetical protein
MGVLVQRVFAEHLPSAPNFGALGARRLYLALYLESCSDFFLGHERWHGAVERRADGAQ